MKRILVLWMLMMALCVWVGLAAEVQKEKTRKKRKARAAAEQPAPAEPKKESAAKVAPAQPAETKEQRDARMKWWREARFGLFIHWGVYSVPAGTWQGQQVKGIGEWIMNRGKIPVAEYAKFPAQFNPVDYNADEWVSLAKEAGMKYIVITSKHHDGFAMFKSQASPYNIYDATPFKRDPLKELAEACRKQGIKLGFYYSQAQDWHHPGGAASGGQWDPAQKGDMDEYIDKIAIPQVREILSNYGPLAILWWDTPTGMTPERAARLFPLTKLQPGIITNNRLGGGYEGDTETPEQRIPATGYPGRDWETCMTMNDTWGYKSYDQNWKPVEVLLRNLADIASKGGNYLLNVGPTDKGRIPDPSIERLRAVGAWMKVNGEAIYATSASPFKKLAWGRCTQKPGRLYLHVFDWPADGTLTIPMKNKITKACLLASPDRSFECDTAETGATIKLTGAAPDPIDSVVVAEIEGAVEPLEQSNLATQEKDGRLVLAAETAEIVGSRAKLEAKGGKPNIGYWTDVKDCVRWKAKIARPGRFAVTAELACDKGSAGGEFTVQIGEETLKGKVESTGDWGVYKKAELGEVSIGKEGPVEVLVQPISKGKVGLMNLRGMELKPVAKE